VSLAVTADEAQLGLKVAFLVLLYLFIWLVVRSATRGLSSGAPQEMGPLNPYERRIVHLAIAEDPAVSSESIGDAFMKTVIISARQ